jgi:hypothetical protein
LTGRETSQSKRYMYLVDWKGNLPVKKGTCTLLTGGETFQSTRYTYLTGWKETLPVGEVHVPLQLEGKPSSQQGTCTSLTGRETFQSTRDIFLVDWKGTFPDGKDVLCRPFKGRVSKDTRQRMRMPLSPEKATGYPDVPGPSLDKAQPKPISIWV